MATYRKLKTGRWQAQVARDGIRRAKSFPTKQEAKDWSSRQEYLIAQGENGDGIGTLGGLFQRYSREASPKKRGMRWEQIRLEAFCRDPIASVKLKDLKPFDFADWRDRRLLKVSNGTVNREMVLMSAVLTVARLEWGVVAKNHITDVRKPPKPPPRDRRVTDPEIARMVEVVGQGLEKQKQRAIHAFRFSIETAMRAGEVVALCWDDIDRVGRVAKLKTSKNGQARKVPLSSAAIALLDELPSQEGESCFNISSQNLDALFRQVRDKSGITGLRFHDSRHESITRLSKVLDILPLARMVGHNDIRMLQVYYNETAEDIAKLLD